MAGAFWGDQHAVDARGRFDLAEVDVEAVRAHQHVAFLQIRLDVLPINIALEFVGQQNVDDIGLLGGFLGAHRFEAVADRQLVILAAGPLADDDVTAAVAEVLRLGVALGTVAEDGDGFAFEDGKIGVVVVINLGGHGEQLAVSY